MTATLHIHTTVQQDGELHLANLPFQQGQALEVAINVVGSVAPSKGLTAQQLLASNLVGLWAGRTDIVDSLSFARTLRGKG